MNINESSFNLSPSLENWDIIVDLLNNTEDLMEDVMDLPDSENLSLMNISLERLNSILALDSANQQLRELDDNGDFMESDEIIEKSVSQKESVLKKRSLEQYQSEETFNKNPSNGKKRKTEQQQDALTAPSTSLKNKKAKKENTEETKLSLEIVRKERCIANLTGNPGELIVFRNPNLNATEPSKAELELNCSNFADSVTSTTTKLEKGILNKEAIKFRPFEYSIAHTLQSLPEKEALFPFIRILKSYQVEAFEHINQLLKGGVVPLLSLAMGLGKTPIYMSLIAKNIAEKEEGISVIITPAATRDKTVQEVYEWFSEVKLSAILSEAQRAPLEFDQFWKSKILMAKWSKHKNVNSLTFWEWWQPLILSAHKLTERFKVSAIDEDQMRENINYAISFYIENCCKKNPDLLKEFLKIEGLLLDENNSYYLSEEISISEVIKLVQKVGEIFPFKRPEPDTNLILPREQSDRLIRYSLSKVGKLDKKQQILKDRNAIIILSYEDVKKICSSKQKQRPEDRSQIKIKENNPLFSLPTRTVIADEASAYHTMNNDLNIVMKAYQKALIPKQVPLIPVTGTPFENNIEELVELLNISNQSKEEGIISENQIKTLSNLEQRGAVALVDYAVLRTDESLQRMQKNIILSFAHALALSESVIRKMVVELDFNHEKVKKDWNNLLPFAKIEKVLFPYNSFEIVNKINQIVNNVFGKSALNNIKLLASNSSITRIHIDSRLKLKSDEGSILKMKDPELANSILEVKSKIERYQKGEVNALDDNFLAKMMIENEEVHRMLKSEEKAIIVYMYDAEAELIAQVLSNYYERCVIFFGDTDQERSESLEKLKQDETNKAVLLLPEKAGGVGLNLGFVSNMIIINDGWNPAIENQAIARICRVGRGGERRILKIFYENVCHDFIRYTNEMKKQLFTFYLSPTVSVKEKFKVWNKIQLYQVIKRLILNGSNAGFYEINGQEVPIFRKYATGNLTSIEEFLDHTIKNLIESLSEEDLKLFVNKATHKIVQSPKVEETLDFKTWRVLPLPEGTNYNMSAALASFIANPNNQEVVARHLVNLSFYLYKFKNDPKELQHILMQARQIGDTGIKRLMNLVKEDRSNAGLADLQTAIYVAENDCFRLKEHSIKDAEATQGILYVKEGSPPRMDILVKIEMLEKWAQLAKTSSAPH